MKIREALEIAERDNVGQCATCTDLAIDGDKFCERCKSYWEEDAPALAEAEWKTDLERLHREASE